VTAIQVGVAKIAGRATRIDYRSDIGNSSTLLQSKQGKWTASELDHHVRELPYSRIVVFLESNF